MYVAEMGTSVNGMKYVSLLTLTLQNAVAVVSIRYYRSRPGDTAIASTGKPAKYQSMNACGTSQ
jgi:hypothetical protein